MGCSSYAERARQWLQNNVNFPSSKGNLQQTKAWTKCPTFCNRHFKKDRSVTYILLIAKIFCLRITMSNPSSKNRTPENKTLCHHHTMAAGDLATQHDDIIKWKHFPRYWPFGLCGIHRLPVNSPHKGQWRGTFTFSFIFAWTNGWVKNKTPVIWDAIAHIMTSL